MDSLTKIAKDFLPGYLMHIHHSKLFKSLVLSIEYFHKNKIVDEKFIHKLISAFAEEFVETFARYPVNSRILEISENSSIVNYRFDRGYWEFVLPGCSIMVSDQSTGRTLYFHEADNIGLEGCGLGLRKGKRKLESINRAHTLQVAKDTRWRANSKEEDSVDEDEDDEDGEWIP